MAQHPDHEDKCPVIWASFNPGRRFTAQDEIVGPRRIVPSQVHNVKPGGLRISEEQRVADLTADHAVLRDYTRFFPTMSDQEIKSPCYLLSQISCQCHPTSFEPVSANMYKHLCATARNRRDLEPSAQVERWHCLKLCENALVHCRDQRLAVC